MSDDRDCWISVKEIEVWATGDVSIAINIVSRAKRAPWNKQDARNLVGPDYTAAALKQRGELLFGEPCLPDRCPKSALGHLLMIGNG
jgi:hypothetical protein